MNCVWSDPKLSPGAGRIFFLKKTLKLQKTKHIDENFKNEANDLHVRVCPLPHGYLIFKYNYIHCFSTVRELYVFDVLYKGIFG